MSESDLRDANLRADKLQAQRDTAVRLLRALVMPLEWGHPDRLDFNEAAKQARTFLETIR